MEPDHRERRRRERRSSSSHEHDAERRRRRGHRATDSQGDLLPRPHRSSRHQSDSEWDSPSPRKRRGDSTPSTQRSRQSAPLSLDAIAKLDKANAKQGGWKGYDYDEQYLKEVRAKEKALEKDRVKEEREERKKERAMESDAAIEAGARRRRESRQRPRAESKRRSATSDNEGAQRAAAQRMSAHAQADRREGRRSHTSAEREERRRAHEDKYTASELAEKKERRRQENARRMSEKKKRVVSGPLAEEGGVDDDDYQYMMEKRGGAGAPSEVTEEELAAKKKKKKKMLIAIASVLLLLAIIIPVAVVVSKKSSGKGGGGSDDNEAAGSSSHPSNSNLDGKDPDSVPDADKGGWLDPWSWWDTDDFNVTYTGEKVGGLPVIGLNSTWDDDVQANDKVPNLKDDFGYGKNPIRGVNVGGWLNLEPFITPSFFESYSVRDNIIDEWTLIQKLGGPSQAKQTLEKHYSSFITRQDFVDIRSAGFDHVRIPFGYWMVKTYDGDQYVGQVAWRYLLRGIEYARQQGLRINLDMHGAPGSQNGWNHSGRQGVIGWLNGTDGETNANRWLDIHHKLAVFFAQDRYKNIVTMYGLVNEPRMVDLNTDDVIKWSQKAITQIRKDGIKAIIVFGDGFRGLDNWKDSPLQTNDDLLLDVHQYVIFNLDQIQLNHTDKLNFACKAWTKQSERSMDTATGFGPTMCGEWSQADTDCTQYINNVNMGTRWEGSLDTGNASTSVLEPYCPLKSSACSCASANTDPSNYSDAYKKWLYQFAIAQMISFEAGWGWFYWTWKTEKATQWSWQAGIKAGILPEKTYDRDFSCPDDVSGLVNYGKLGLAESY
ncbi:glycoside hydrolase family 5 protein [Karstenula rhodostoma CBS 690.94]|uniref:glucan 1,3-beta-glucosidase n=1 Tax=Karstenula rhodostoma CBS 690.94 TaxID=1392251 RepID=A0A9P4U5T8_9PLEO|nr:glycoside hydrolase family 5 protein [Karstenula rhodostoma CBS 690.94]